MLKEVLIGAGGIAVGYFVARRAMERKYILMLDQEVKRTKEFFAAEASYEGSQEGLEDPAFMEAAIKAANSMTEYSAGEVKVQPSILAQELEKSVENDPDLEVMRDRVKNYQKPESIVDDEVDDIESNRAASPLDPDARPPHLITFGEFDQNETGYEQISVSYFAGDGVVIDEEDNTVSPERVEQIIGTDNLNKFGTNTDDPDMEPNVIYVRCERFEMDFEVTRSPGKYSVEVLGETG